MLGLAVVFALLAVAAAGCGSGGGSEKRTGEAAAAVARYWMQERDAGRLPEGRDVVSVGTEQVKPLDKGESDARVCVQYRYTDGTTPFAQHNRVYVATLSKGAWAVEPVKPEGNCDDVV
jgi:hypothetical protein